MYSLGVWFKVQEHSELSIEYHKDRVNISKLAYLLLVTSEPCVVLVPSRMKTAFMQFYYAPLHHSHCTCPLTIIFKNRRIARFVP